MYNSIKENFVAIEQLSPLVALPNLGADLGGAVNSYFTNAFTPVYGPVFGPYYATLLSNTYAAVGNGLAAMGAIELYKLIKLLIMEKLTLCLVTETMEKLITGDLKVD